MTFQVRFSSRLQVPGQSITENKSATVEDTRHRTTAIADGVTDFEIKFAIDVSELVAFGVKSDVAMTVETNSGSSPQETFVLAAGKPIHFFKGDSAVFAGDVTSFFVTNASGEDGTIELVAAQHEVTI